MMGVEISVFKDVGHQGLLMQTIIWLVSVFLGLSCSFFWSVGVFALALPSALRSPLAAPLTVLLSFFTLAIWVAGLMVMWKILLSLTERLVAWISSSDSEKKKKRPPQHQELV